MKKRNIRKRVIFVISFIIICTMYFYINLRGDYLQTIAIDKKYIDVFKTNIKLRTEVFAISFIILFIISFITTVVIKKGLKKFFIEENREMPKLPNKSISFAFAVIGSIFVINKLYDNIVLAFSNVWFGKGDPIFNLDISYYMFIIPFIKQALSFLAILFAVLTVYVITYSLIVFNKYFHKGISFETLKKNTILKHISANLMIITIMISLLVIVSITNISNEGFMQTQDGTTLYGAGLVEITIKGLGYLIFAIFIIICVASSIKKIKNGEYKKGVLHLLLIPAYLVIMFLLIISTEFIYLRRNEFDKEKEYIAYNIEATKSAYDIKLQEIDIKNGGTITTEDLENNKQLFNNINLLDEEIVLQHLKEYQTTLGYYSFNRAQELVYNNELVYVSPREILSNNTRTYNNKTYQYTHGYDVIANSASEFESTGTLKYKRSGFNGEDEFLNVVEPRIYFGLQTDEVIVTNLGNNPEYDYPISSTANAYNKYDGDAGIHLNFVDRLILGIKEKNLKLAFSNEMAEESNIIINRNILNRAKSILPYIQYDPNPYLIVTDDNRLVWVLDGYTTSNNYPYSQKTNVLINNEYYNKINYIRNSVKVFIDAYNGTMEFYITDRTDPIIMAYWSKYPVIFEDINKDIPKEYKNHLIYPKFLYNIQVKQIERYHDVQPEVLYRADDVWSVAKEKITTLNKDTETKPISPYYTIVKTTNNLNYTLGLVEPYIINGKQNITSYLVGTDKLTVYRFVGDTATLGTTQLERLIEEDENVAKEIETLKVAGTKIEKKLFVVPINDKLIYVEPIYQVLINENQVPILKKVVVASGDKLAIGNNLEEGMKNLLSQSAVNIEVEEDSVEYLIQEIIKANKNLEESNFSNDWTMIGNDIERLQTLIYKLERVQKEQYLSE